MPNSISCSCPNRQMLTAWLVEMKAKAQISFLLQSLCSFFFHPSLFLKKIFSYFTLLYQKFQWYLNYFLDWCFMNNCQIFCNIISQRKDLTYMSSNNLKCRRSVERGAWLCQLALLGSGKHCDIDWIRFSFPFHCWKKSKTVINCNNDYNSTKALIRTNTMQVFIKKGKTV